MKTNHALLYLDDLTVAQFATPAECAQARQAAIAAIRPFVLLRFRQRANREIWMPQETSYLSNR